MWGLLTSPDWEGYCEEKKKKLIKAINPGSGRAAGGDFPRKTWTCLDVPTLSGRVRVSWLSGKGKSKL